jgi:hypothetical protein
MVRGSLLEAREPASNQERHDPTNRKEPRRENGGEELWRKCSQYVACDASEAKTRFREFVDLFGLSKPFSIATVATFPAFMDPDRFPMVDTRIAKWVSHEMDKHNLADPTGALLTHPTSKKGVLKMHDFDFMFSWTQWCRHTAQKLTLLEDGFRWRARDVEMAVFQAWGDKKAKRHPSLNLLPLPLI